MSIQLVRQHDIKDCGAACLSMVFRHYHLKLPMAKLRALIKVDNHGANIYGLVEGATQMGLKTTASQGNPDEFLAEIQQKNMALPVIARVIVDQTLEHFVVVYKITQKYIYVADPAIGKIKYNHEDFFRIWSGHIVSFEKTARFQEADECKGTLKKFIRLVTSQKRLLFGVLAISLLISLISMAGAFIFQIIIDGIESNDLYSFNGFTLAQICIGMIVLYVFQAVIGMVRSHLLSVLSKNVDLSLMLNCYNHITKLPLKHISNMKTGELLSRFNDAASIETAISSATLSLVLDTGMVILCTFLLHHLNEHLFLVTLCTVLAYAFIVMCFLKPIRHINEGIMKENAEATSFLKESIDGIQTVKAFGTEKMVQQKYSAKYTGLVKKSMKGVAIYNLQVSLSELIASVGVIFLLWCGTKLVIQNQLSIGTLITFYSLLGYFLEPIQRLINLQPELQTAVVAAERLNDILDLTVEDEGNESVPLDNPIEIRDVSFRYGNRELVLDNINMEIKSGETIALVGESGSGKTTLAKLIMAFYEPESGEICIGHQNISKLSPKNVRDNIAYISQEVFLFSGTIKENLTFGNPDVSMADIENACKMSMADEFIRKMPMGYDTLIGENGHDLSGGQKQRLAIARALLKKPKILIMDEATSNLDTITEAGIRNTIAQLNQKITCIIIAHRLVTIKNCDRIYVMEQGKVVESGTHTELLEKGEAYATFWHNQ